MKKVNLGVYEIIKLNKDKPHYDILLCKDCSLTCLRCNFSRHKTSPRHIQATSKKEVLEKVEVAQTS
jgi:hypothetical protein